jgi:hypothetical protein
MRVMDREHDHRAVVAFHAGDSVPWQATSEERFRLVDDGRVTCVEEDPESLRPQ